MDHLKKISLTFSLSMLFILFTPTIIFAQAKMFISPATGTYATGESFSVLVEVNTGGDAINAGVGQIQFDNSRLEVTGVGYSQSIFSLWAKTPSYSNTDGTITFSGGLPSPGFSGSSGPILRVTFMAKGVGSAPVQFSSGSVLANDGKGSDITSGLFGALYSITPANQPINSQQVISSVKATSTAEQSIEVPTISQWPSQLEAGGILTVSGLGFPTSKIIIVIQKDQDDPIYESTFSGFDGQFTFTFERPVQSGYYRIWAQTVMPSGSSGLSNVVTTVVIPATFIQVGGTIFSYVSLVVTVLALVILACILCFLLWRKYRKLRMKQGVEISHAEKTVHRSFDTLKDALNSYLGYLAGAGTKEGLKRREKKTQEELQSGLKEMEEKIEKEIENIGNLSDKD